jgi:hypothetical protein
LGGDNSYGIVIQELSARNIAFRELIAFHICKTTKVSSVIGHKSLVIPTRHPQLTAAQRNAEKTALDISLFMALGPAAFKISSAPSTCAIYPSP